MGEGVVEADQIGIVGIPRESDGFWFGHLGDVVMAGLCSYGMQHDCCLHASINVVLEKFCHVCIRKGKYALDQFGLPFVSLPRRPSSPVSSGHSG